VWLGAGCYYAVLTSFTPAYGELNQMQYAKVSNSVRVSAKAAGFSYALCTAGESSGSATSALDGRRPGGAPPICVWRLVLGRSRRLNSWRVALLPNRHCPGQSDSHSHPLDLCTNLLVLKTSVELQINRSPRNRRLHGGRVISPYTTGTVHGNWELVFGKCRFKLLSLLPSTQLPPGNRRSKATRTLSKVAAAAVRGGPASEGASSVEEIV
jgi:hypothetical protein